MDVKSDFFKSNYLNEHLFILFFLNQTYLLLLMKYRKKLERKYFLNAQENFVKNILLETLYFM